MSFQPKRFVGITADMIRHMQSTQDAVTDFHIGSVARTLVEAPAIELDEFYQRVLSGLREAIPEAIYQAFAFDPLPAFAARGMITFSVPVDVVDAVPIPAGTVVRRPGTRLAYITEEAAEIPAGGSSVSVPAHAQWAGYDGNAGAGSITEIATPFHPGAEAINPAPFTGGRDQESAADRKARFVDYVGSLSRGTVWAVLHAARSARILDDDGMTIEWVSRVGMDEGAGHVDLYLLGSGGPPTTHLLRAAQMLVDGWHDGSTWIPGYRPVGVRVSCLPMTARAVDVSLRLGMFDGDPDTYALRDVLELLLGGVMPGDVLTVGQVSEAVLRVHGVRSVVVLNTSNEACGNHEFLVLGELVIEEE